MSNLLFKTKKVKGRGTVYLTPCPHNSDPHIENRVGNPRCCNKNCPRFRKFTYTQKGVGVHCEDFV